MPRVMVTGAPGYVGAAAVRALVDKGDDVIAIIQPGVPTQRLAGLPITQVVLDLEDGIAVGRSLEQLRPDAILHAAWYANPSDYLTSPRALASLHATVSLLEACARTGCRRFVGVGTCLEYATSSSRRNEEDRCEPRTLYASCKLAAWLVCRALAAQTDTSFAWTRLFYLYGPDENPGRLLPALVSALRDGRPFPMTDGSQMRDYMHVDDVGRALAALCKHSFQGLVNIGSGQSTAVRDFALTVAKILGTSSLVRIGELPRRPDEEMFVVADNSRLQGLGFRPKYLSLEEGLRDALRTTTVA
jgi:nucleoside-diphosphate-sugar epimerase